MAESWLDKLGLSKLSESVGSGTLVGGAVGGALALLGVLTGAMGSLGWLGWLLVPALALAGAVAGDFVKKDGFVFGEHGALKLCPAPNFMSRFKLVALR